MGIRNLLERLLGDVSTLSTGRTVVISELSAGTSFSVYRTHKFDSQNKVYFTKLALQDISKNINNILDSVIPIYYNITSI
ncbi:hypothetical protein ALC57_17024 [Trachymyrmex cornetzi]|uniref:Uncharacterized protein n=1 Tax=Trachymyrmex cornetzi TaxID=471704 RepID=A0A195DEH3_9HYME|nr:hypothetical protein ALC57_17024 [Trachymyrmex cornetzi]